MIRLAIGFDRVEAAAYGVFGDSAQDLCSMPISVAPVNLLHFKGLLDRPRDPKQSNDFSFSRFLVPYMYGYEGWAIFADCDMMARDDIAKLWALRDERYAVQVVKHNYEVDDGSIKYLGNIQYKYGRKNWSSVMLMNCSKLRMLTPEYVNTAHGLELHQFQFLPDELIGWLPKRWNHLVGVYPYDPDAAIVHWTSGGCWFKGFENVDYADEWRNKYKWALNVKQRSKVTFLTEEDLNTGPSER